MKKCVACGIKVRIRKNGTLYNHGEGNGDDGYCSRSGSPAEWHPDAPGPGADISKLAAEASASPKGPWFGARFPGICEGCGNGFDEGDMIRADGNDGWECEEWCGQDDPADERHVGSGTLVIPWQTEKSRAAESAPDSASEAMAFLNGTAGVQVPEPDAPPARKETDRYGYLIKDPQTGEFRRWKNGNIKGITRCTTFNKSASDRTALTEWAKRNVLIGASRRPDLVLRAHGLDVTADKDALADLVEQLEDAAGAKVSASIGTAVHDLTERIDRGELTFTDVPVAYRGHVESYCATLEEAGLSVVPDLIEQTIFFKEYGGVAGKFDRILYHRASDSYLMGDLKTGKTMSYGWDEIECQEYIYATGYNEFGTYVRGDAEDGSQDHWEVPRVQVRKDKGVVMWLPVQGPNAGVCTLLMTDLERGAQQAELCGTVREARSAKPKPVPWTGLPSAGEIDWERKFSSVRTGTEAAALWEAASKDPGMTPDGIQALVALARKALGMN